MKKAAAVAILGLSLIILIYLYYVLTNYRVIRPIHHGDKLIDVLRLIGFVLILPFFVKFRQRRLTV